MVKSFLSDDEWFEILSLMNAQEPERLKLYLNNLLYERGRGTDACARPLHFRENEDKNSSPCYAIGYIDKLMSFLTETSLREADDYLAIQKTREYATKLKEEINRFFKPSTDRKTHA